MCSGGASSAAAGRHALQCTHAAAPGARGSPALLPTPPNVHPCPHLLQGGFAVGPSLTVADLALFDLTDLYLTKYGDKLRLVYPVLTAHYDKVAALPRIAAYLASPQRPSK